MTKIERVSFEVTGKCNLNCFYCCRGYLNSTEKISKEISTELIISTIQQAREQGCESFLFTGGEAFVKEDLDKILSECEGCFVEIYSNGTLIAEPKNIELIKKYVSRLTVTIDGTNSHNFYRTGSDFLKIINNIKKFMTKDKSLFLITHYNKIFQQIKPDKVYLIIDGKIIKQGNLSLIKEIEKKGYKNIK